MTNTLQAFSYAGHQFRTETVDGVTVFSASDVCDVVGISKTRDAVAQLDSDERASMTVDTLGGKQQINAVTESGVFSLMLISRSPQVKPFKRWLTHEVLPAIRRTGSFNAPDLSGSELMARALIEAHSTMDNYRARVQELAPLADAWEKLASASGDYSVRDAAQVLCRDGGIQIGQNRLFRYLREAERPWLDKHSRPYQWAVDAGLVAEKISSFKFQRTNGEEQLAAPQVRISAKGLQRLHRELNTSKELVSA